MEKYKHQFIVLLIALVIGAVGGILFSGSRHNSEIEKLNEQHKKELKWRVDSAIKVIEGRDETIKELHDISLQDSLLIKDLYKKIEQDGVKVTSGKRQELKNLSHAQKVNWLSNRYTRKPQ